MMFITTTTFDRAPVVTEATPIQNGGIASITLMHYVAMEQERILVGLRNAMQRAVDPMRPDALFCDQNDMTVFTTLTQRANDLGCILQSYFDGEGRKIGDVAREIPEFIGYDAQQELLEMARDSEQDAAAQREREAALARARVAEVNEASRARQSKATRAKLKPGA